MVFGKRAADDENRGAGSAKVARTNDRSMYDAVMRSLYTLVHSAVKSVVVLESDDDATDFINLICDAVKEQVDEFVSNVKEVPWMMERLAVPTFPQGRVEILLHDIAACLVSMMQHAGLHAMRRIDREVNECGSEAELVTLFCGYVNTAAKTYAVLQDIYEECEKPLHAFFGKQSYDGPDFNYWLRLCREMPQPDDDHEAIGLTITEFEADNKVGARGGVTRWC